MNIDNISKVNLLGLDVYKMNMNDVLELCKQRIAQRRQLLLGVVNVAKLVNSQKNEQLRKSVEDADVVLADGLAVVWLSKLIGNPLPERVTGIDIMTNLFEISDKMNYRVYFLGAKRAVVEKVVEYVSTNHAGLKVVGYRDGYFDEDESELVAQDIKDSNADILFVAMTSPKKEKFLSRWSEYMNIPVCHGVGGSFDVMTGVTKRAPLWMQNIGMEWFYRVLQEPRRMWKRYLVTNTIFAGLAFKAIIQTRLGIAKS